MANGAEVYEVGDEVGIGVQFGTPDEPVDPRQVEVRVQGPDGRSAHLAFGKDEAVQRVAPGAYQMVVTATVAGRWKYRFVGIRPNGAHEGYFDVFDLASG
ncbi:MAG: hypothetical protein AB1673_16805 [Actinomycetota bacterium]|jgi:hypothetical protein